MSSGLSVDAGPFVDVGALGRGRRRLYRGGCRWSDAASARIPVVPGAGADGGADSGGRSGVAIERTFGDYGGRDSGADGVEQCAASPDINRQDR